MNPNIKLDGGVGFSGLVPPNLSMGNLTVRPSRNF
jgi:hypothetical protein